MDTLTCTHPTEDCRHAPVQARLWLNAADLGEQDADARLWLHLPDKRVLAFRLPAAQFGNDAVIAPLLAAVSDDLRGTLLEINHPAFDYAIPMYAASAAPMLHARHPRHAAACAFAAGLDQAVLHLLARLNTHRYWGSARNYNRLAALPDEAAARKMQAVARFPLLAAPIVLTAHHWADHFGGKRFAWRNHDDAVIDAIERGRDLSGALAAHYGISKSLVRAPVCSEMWGNTRIAHTRLLHLLGGIPAHQRPVSWHELERAVAHLPALERLVDENGLATLGQPLFKSGWNTVWAACESRFAPLSRALYDSHDFLRAAAAQARASRTRAPSQTELARRWLGTHGLISLLDASRRWHAFLQRYPAAPGQPGANLPAVIGTYTDGGCRARELTQADDLAREGHEMHHCVASYWHSCATDGTRIFAIVLDNGERATAEYACGRRLDHDLEFTLCQLRGHSNRDVSLNMESFAHALEIRLNHPRQLANRQVLLAQLAQPAPPPATPAVTPLDPTSQRQLAALLINADRADPLANLPSGDSDE